MLSKLKESEQSDGRVFTYQCTANYKKVTEYSVKTLFFYLFFISLFLGFAKLPCQLNKTIMYVYETRTLWSSSYSFQIFVSY